MIYSSYLIFNLMEQTAIAQRANPYQRIIYVEPNDVYDKEVKN